MHKSIQKLSALEPETLFHALFKEVLALFLIRS